MEFVIGLVLLLAVLGGIILLVTGEDRYARMSEREFEEEARRGSALGSAMLEMQKIVDPRNKAEYLQRRDKHVEADGAEAGEGPPGDKPRSRT